MGRLERNSVEMASVCFRLESQARVALGHVKYQDLRLTADELQQAHGFAKHGEAWVTPVARCALVKIEEGKFRLFFEACMPRN